MTDRDRRAEAGARDGIETSRPIGRRRDDRLVGASAAMQRVIEGAAAAGRSEAPVLVAGPPGSGKKLVARAVHAWSVRASGLLVALACDAASPLQAPELFGSAAATGRRVFEAESGALARAAGGSLLLAHAERLDPALSERLAGALASGVFSREGELETQPLRARVLATAEDPREAALFDGCAPHVIVIPPLRERPEDVLPLAAHFLAAFAPPLEGALGFTEDARRLLLCEAWPGDVRELRERVRQAVALSEPGPITAEALLLAAEGDRPPLFKEAKRAFEVRYVSALLRHCGGNVSRAARLAGKDRKDFYDVIRRNGLDLQRFRD